MSKQQELQIINEKIKTCRLCPLYEKATLAVSGAGQAQAEIMIIGEAPGKNEDLCGEPFVGTAGKLLNELLGSINLQRQDVFITNVVKHRPPNNRDPLPNEVTACWPFLEKQLTVIRPKMILLLGRHSLNRFFPDQKISEAHGRALRKNFPPLGKTVFFPCYHPAAALYQGSLRETLFKDFKKIPAIMKLIRKEEKTSKEYT